MPHYVTVPAFSAACREATLLEWLNRADGVVRPSDSIARFEIDHGSLELEADVNGVIVWQAVSPGCTVSVGTTIAVIALENENEVAIRDIARQQFPLLALPGGGPPLPQSFISRFLGLRS